MTTEDQWAAIEAAIPEVLEDAVALLRDPELRRLAEDRFRVSAETFGDSWLTRDLDWFSAEAREECADLIVYTAMEYVRVRLLTSRLPAD